LFNNPLACLLTKGQLARLAISRLMAVKLQYFELVPKTEILEQR
jgi:hypothetical protein